MTTVQAILDQKPRELWTVAPDETVYEALALLAEKDIGALPVMVDERLEGIFSERDYARKVILKGKSSRDLPVREIMTSSVFCLHPEQSAEEAMTLMTEHRVRHVPVKEGDHVLGIISIGDVVKAIISEREFVIEQLESYISSAR